MARLLLTFVTACSLVLAACGDDGGDGAGEDVGEDVGGEQAFCERFADQPSIDVGVFDEAAVTETLDFFTDLRVSAPAEVEDDLDVVVEELDALVEAMAEYEGVEGQEAIDAIQQAGDVDLDALTSAATAVGEYAAQTCQDVPSQDG